MEAQAAWLEERQIYPNTYVERVTEGQCDAEAWPELDAEEILARMRDPGIRRSQQRWHAAQRPAALGGSRGEQMLGGAEQARKVLVLDEVRQAVVRLQAVKRQLTQLTAEKEKLTEFVATAGAVRGRSDGGSPAAQDGQSAPPPPPPRARAQQAPRPAPTRVQPSRASRGAAMAALAGMQE